MISALLTLTALAILVGYARNRRCDYGSIQPAEVNPDVAAGETLLREALLADGRSCSAELQLSIEDLPLHIQ